MFNTRIAQFLFLLGRKAFILRDLWNTNKSGDPVIKHSKTTQWPAYSARSSQNNLFYGRTILRAGPSGGEIFTFLNPNIHLQYPPYWVAHIFSKELLHRICLKANYFLFGDHFINSHKLFSCLYADVGRSWDLKGLKNQQTNKSKQNKNKEYKRRGELQAIDSHASNQLQQHLNRQPVFIGSKIRSDQSDSRRKWFRKIKRPRDFPFFLWSMPVIIFTREYTVSISCGPRVGLLE